MRGLGAELLAPVASSRDVRWDLCQRVVVSRADQATAARARRAARCFEVSRRPFQLEPPRRRRGGLAPRSLRLLLAPRNVAAVRQRSRLHRARALLPSLGSPPSRTAVARDGAPTRLDR